MSKIICDVCGSSYSETEVQCPICGTAIHALGNTLVSCCGITLPALEADDTDEDHAVTIEDVEDEHFITIRHPMTKQH